MNTATIAARPAGARREPGHPAEQELLLGHLADDVRGRLAGDHPDRKVIRHRRPSQELQLGVLPALPQPDPDGHETPEQLARRINRPPSQIGVNFNLLPDGDRGAVDVAASFSFYVQRYPEFDDQRAQAGQQQSTGDDGAMTPAVPLPRTDAAAGAESGGPGGTAEAASTMQPCTRGGAGDGASAKKKTGSGPPTLSRSGSDSTSSPTDLPVVLDLTRAAAGPCASP